MHCDSACQGNHYNQFRVWRIITRRCLRLIQKYGNQRKIVDLIISDLHALKPVADGDDKGLIKMIDTVETCYLDLKKVKLQAEMSSTNVLGMVERVMLLTQKREWVAVMDDNGCSLDFDKLLEYLLTQKRKIEYMGSAVRTIGNHHKSSIMLLAWKIKIGIFAQW